MHSAAFHRRRRPVGRRPCALADELGRGLAGQPLDELRDEPLPRQDRGHLFQVDGARVDARRVAEPELVLENLVQAALDLPLTRDELMVYPIAAKVDDAAGNETGGVVASRFETECAADPSSSR